MWIVLVLPAVLFGLWAQWRVQATYQKYVRVPSRGRITGREAAAAVLRAAGVTDVTIHETAGTLTDHYDPQKRRLVLSQDNYQGTSLAALGVAAHEAGHAIQHKVKYPALQLRMSLVGVTSFASQALNIVMIIALFSAFAGGMALGVGVIKIVIACMALITFFQLVTLPVEFDASKRAKAQLLSLGIVGQDEMVGVNKTLDAAAWTYVAAFIVSLMELIHWVMILVSRRE